VDPKQLKTAEARATLARVEKGRWALKALNTALADRQFIVDGAALLGRSNDCDITLGVAHFSRKHASLTVEEGGLVVQDLQSSNGTFVNGKRVERATLKPGDELNFDTLRFTVLGPGYHGEGDKTRVREDHDKTSIRSAVQFPEDEIVKNRHPVKKSHRHAGQRAAIGSSGDLDRGSEPAQETSLLPYAAIGVVFLMIVAAGWYFLSH